LKAYEETRSPEYKNVFLRWSDFENQLAWIKRGCQGRPPKPELGAKKPMPYPIETRNGSLKSADESESDNADDNHSTTNTAKQNDLKRKHRDSPAVAGPSTSTRGAPVLSKSSANEQGMESEEPPSSAVPVEPVIGHMLNALMHQTEANIASNRQIQINDPGELDLDMVESMSDTSIGRPKKKKTSAPAKK
jgi:hypothetical protein